MPTRSPALERLAADDLKRAFVAYRDVLRDHQDRLNRLNVYPVPDGDTGTNMALTLESVVAELEQATDMPSTCTAISHGSLMGARGNSGVILSQVLRGIADGCKAGDDAGPQELAAAFVSAADAAYGAVMRPVEGTILTVARAAGEGARTAAEDDVLLCALLDAARDAAQAALEQTPELLPVLKQAGVVDAGGAGLVLLLDAFLHVADGRALPEAPDLPVSVGATRDLDAPEDNLSGLRYEVMYFLEAPDETIPDLKRVWSGIGDSIVVVGGDGLWNCHIHTDDVGGAIEAALDCGRPRNIRVTDLLDQVEEERWVREGASDDDEDDADLAGRTAVVAVATGPGIKRIFRSLGARKMIAGGQSMNPSTAQILEAVEAASANEVVVLPNNKNIVAVAEQVHELTAKTVRVVPTHSVTEGFAALLAYDPEASVEENAEVMRDAAARVVSGEVTRAIRATDSPAGPISDGDWLGLSRDGIETISASLADATCALLDRLVLEQHEIVMVIEGEGANPADTRRITEWLAEHRHEVSVEVHHGGQPLYPYLLSIE